MAFVKSVWRLLMVLKDGLTLIFLLLFFLFLYLFLTASPNPGKVVTGPLLLNMRGTIVEQASSVDAATAILGQADVQPELVLRDLIRGLDMAAKDERVQALILDFSEFSGGGQASISEVANAVAAVKRAGKPVLAYSSAYFDDSYLIAAHANEIWVDPLGQAIIQGPGGTQPYFKGLADRLGVSVNVFKVGTHKAAVEPFIATQASPEAKADRQALYDGLWSNWKEEVAKARPKAQMDAAIKAPITPSLSLAQSAQKLGLVDTIGSNIAFSKYIASKYGEAEEARPDAFAATLFEDWIAANPAATGGSTVGVLTVAGDIIDGEAGPNMAAGNTISELLYDALKEKDLKALVVRIDSPGGSVAASDQIRNAVIEAKEQGIPVLVSMGNVAASGGYWIATAGDQIFAEPSTITGSIGVFAIIPTIEKTLLQYGVTTDGVATTPLSGQPDILSGVNANTSALFQAGVEDIYRQFTSLVAKARKLDVKRVDEIGQGRVWLGGNAKQIGLVDRFGTLNDAIAEAAKQAKLEPANVEIAYIEPQQSIFSGLWGTGAKAKTHTKSNAMPRDAASKLIAKQKSMLMSALYDAYHILHGPSVQVRCLTCPVMGPARDMSGIAAWVKKVEFNDGS